MKKNIALFMIVNMIMVIFTVANIQPVYAEQKTCCVIENSCSLMSSADCSAISGRDSGVVSCNSVTECNTGCCVTANSCDSGRTKTYCNQNGGSWNSGDCSGKSECATGVCIINGICYDDYSKRQCDAAGLGAQFDVSIQDCESANALLSGSEGCCITGNSFVRTTSSACNGGRFVSGYLCSSAVSGSNCLPRDHKTCFNGKVYWVDSCGNRENVADNLAEHTAYNQANSRILSDSVLKNNIGYCKIEDGKSCGVDNKGNVACLDMNCDLGESFYTETNFDPEIAMFLDSESVKIEQNFLGETSGQQKGNRRLLYTQFAPSKENTDIRKNGESWCMLWPQPNYNSDREEANPASPGSRDYVFTCLKGKIEIEPCADYRSEICDEGYDKNRDITTARCEDNRWEECSGSDRNGCKDKNKLCRFVDGECVPLVPPGNVFWSEDISAGNKAICEKCGSGWWNRCSEPSCVRLGDCRGVQLGMLGRVLRLALINAVLGAAVLCTVVAPGACFGWLPGVGGGTAPAASTVSLGVGADVAGEMGVAAAGVGATAGASAGAGTLGTVAAYTGIAGGVSGLVKSWAGSPVENQPVYDSNIKLVSGDYSGYPANFVYTGETKIFGGTDYAIVKDNAGHEYYTPIGIQQQGSVVNPPTQPNTLSPNNVPRVPASTQQTPLTSLGTQNQQCSGYVFSSCVNNKATVFLKKIGSGGSCDYIPKEGCDCNSNSDYSYLFVPTSCNEILKKYT